MTSTAAHSTSTTGAAPAQRRIRVDGAAHATALRHYFLRLGCEAWTPDATHVLVTPPPGGLDLGRALASWAGANGVAAAVVDDAPPSPPPPPPPSAPEPPRSASPPQPRLRIGDMLIRKGMITPEQLEQALAESKLTGGRVGEILLGHRWVFEDELARTLAEQLRLPYVNVASVGVDWSAVRLLPQLVGHRYGAIPVRFASGGVVVAFADPSDDEALAAVTQSVGPPVLAVAELTPIRTLWRSVAGR